MLLQALGQLLGQHAQPQQPAAQVTPQAANTAGQANQYLNAQQFPQLAQGGNFDPGHTPLQNNHPVAYGRQPQPVAQFRGMPIPQQNNFNPQNPFTLY
jgi:hypothetical protein